MGSQGFTHDKLYYPVHWPPAVYTKQHNFNKEDLMAGLANDPNTEDRVAFACEEEGELVKLHVKVGM